MNPSPHVSVVMPVYNGESYIRPAIESILAQTYTNFEFIVINDGSTDSSLGILNEYRDRLRVYSQTNQGVAVALNRGLEMAGGDFIARMDADDIALPHRLEAQINFLNANPEIGVVGTNAMIIDENGRILRRQNMPASDLEIRWVSLFTNPMIHSTIMLHRSILPGNLAYDPALDLVEDYDLWIRLLSLTRFANLSEPLLQYRIHRKGISSARRNEQREKHRLVSQQALTNIGLSDTLDIELFHQLIDELIFRDSRVTAQEERASLAMAYLSIWLGFSKRYAKSPSLENLSRQVIKKASRMILYPFFQKYLLKGIESISKIAPDWFFIFLSSLPEGVVDVVSDRWNIIPSR